MELNTSPRFIKIKDVVKGILIREKDFLREDELLMESIAKDVYKELNLGSIRDPIRRIIEVDKRTNTIQFPDDYMFFSSISRIDDCGRIEPMIINTNIKSDIPDISLINDCGCECGCNSHLCSAIKNYELIQEDIAITMPDNTVKVFKATTRKKIMKDGSYVMETITPTKKYEAGVYTGVEMITKDDFLCHLEVEDCGCISHTEENVKMANSCSNAVDYAIDCGCTICPSEDHNAFNFSEEGDRIQFSSHFKEDSVLLRYYPNKKTKDILLPIVARRHMVCCIMVEMLEHDDKAPLWRIQYWMAEKTKSGIVLRDKLNEINLKSFLKAILGRRKMV